MNFLELAKQRCSVRKYKTDAIEKEKLDKLLEAARIAPTAANMQSHRLLVVTGNEGLNKMSKGVNFHGAPLVIIVCGDHSNVFGQEGHGKCRCNNSCRPYCARCGGFRT